MSHLTPNNHEHQNEHDESDDESDEEDEDSWKIEIMSKKKNKKHNNVCPEAQVCDRRLYLPQYSSKTELKKMLVMALEYGAMGYDRM